MKRFTATEKWDDSWFRKLTPELKCFWSFICERCDCAGVWKVDLEAAEFFVGAKFKDSMLLEKFTTRIQDIGGGRWWIVKFVEFQYGRLSPDCKPHIPIFKALERHGFSLDTLSKPFLKAIDSLEEEETETEEDQDSVPDAREDEPDEPIGVLSESEVCAYCGATEVQVRRRFQIEHFVPRCLGGSSEAGNLLKACGPCNGAKQGRLFDSVEDCRTWLHWRFWMSGRARYERHRAYAFGGVPPNQETVRRGLELHQKTAAQPNNSRLFRTSPKFEPNPENPHNLSGLGLQISRWFNRRPSTQWSDRELRELRKVEAFKTPEEDILLLEQRYLSGSMYNRKEILTLLNNWNGEIDRCRSQTNGHGAATTADHAQGF